MKPLFKTGDVVLINQHKLSLDPRSWVAEGIRKFCHTEFNHCGIIVFNWGMPVLNNALASGVYPTPLDVALAGKHIMIRRPKIEVIEHDFAIRSNSFVGRTKYDYRSVFINQPIYILTGKWVGKDGPSADGRMNCSEYIGRCHNLKDSFKLSPFDLLVDKNFDTIFDGIYE